MKVTGVRSLRMLVAPPPDPWTEVRVERGPLDRAQAPSFDERRATLELRDGGHVVLDRERRTAGYFTPAPLTDDELVHPFLAPVGAVFARWLGRQALHAAAFLADGGAWAVLGGRGAGKSTTIAGLHLKGHPVLTDDVLVIDGGVALAGPRSIDLRGDAAEGLEAVAAPARGGTRERIVLPAVPAEVPIVGLIFLEWGESLESRRLPPGELLGRLSRCRMARRLGEDPLGLLEVAALPGWVVERPRAWGSLPGLLDRIAAIAAP